jgi:ferritin-like metal-binding protein YciE
MNTLRETLINVLKDTYDAEHQILAALPKLIGAVRHEELKEALEAHMEETRGQVMRLEKLFAILEETPRRRKCKGMEGLLAEIEELIAEEEGDAILTSAAQKVEHYEISAYGSMSAWADMLGEDEAVDLLEETLSEETEADEKLTELAETIINPDEEREVEPG